MEEKAQKYTLTLNGRVWRYGHTFGGALGWIIVGGDETNIFHAPFDLRTAADYRAVGDVMERWERDHAPVTRRRVVQDALGRYWARHEFVGGYVHGITEDAARACARAQESADVNDAALAAVAELQRLGYDEDVPRNSDSGE